MDSFVRSNSEKPKSPGPPNYFARAIQVRLLAVVGCLLLVLVLMGEARKPQNWEWMWAGQAPTAETSSEQVPTRLPAQPRAASAEEGYASSGEPARTSEDPAARVERQAWSTSLARLSKTERDALDAILRESRRPARLKPPLTPEWAAALTKISLAWDEYLNSVQSALMERPGEDRLKWTGILEAVEQRWRHEWLPVLSAADAEAAWTQDESAILQQVQAAVDRYSLDQVEDDSVFRPAEHQAWFRLFEKLAASTRNDLKRLSEGQVSYVQLFQQPAEYRGKVVTVRGSARLGYRVPATSNTTGIDHYYVLWVKPVGGQLSPLIVYCLELPQGFPKTRDKYEEGGPTQLSEEIAVEGYFFKRQAYRARDGLNTAPVLLAKVPRWFPSEKPPADPFPSVGVAILAIAGVLLAACGLAWMAYVSSRGRLNAIAQRRQTDFRVLSNRETAPPVSEALQELARREKADEIQARRPRHSTSDSFLEE